MLKRWETANQMRKWTQKIKLDISERIAKEVEQAFRDEINEANPSAEPFTAPLSDEQKATVEDKTTTKFDQEVQKTYDGVVQKANSLVRLAVPSQYKRSNPLMARMVSAMSVQLQKNLSVQSTGGSGNPSLRKRGSIIMIDRQQTKVDKEYNWTDRLAQWKKIQMSEGAIIDLSSKSQMNSQSASLAILGLLQSEFSVEQINKTLEDSLVNGVRRSAGLNLINFAMGLAGNP